MGVLKGVQNSPETQHSFETKWGQAARPPVLVFGGQAGTREKKRDCK